MLFFYDKIYADIMKLYLTNIDFCRYLHNFFQNFL